MANSTLALKIPEALQPKLDQVHEDIAILQSPTDFAQLQRVTYFGFLTVFFEIFYGGIPLTFSADFRCPICQKSAKGG